MSTRAAIAVYTEGVGVPEHVGARAWRGVYHHWDGHPEGLGRHLIYRVRAARGDMGVVVAELIDQAPWGWSSCITGAGDAAGGRLPEGEGPRVSPAETGQVHYVYAFDVAARRLDAFATHGRGEGRRVGSVTFSAAGEPDVPALDLLPEERLNESLLPGGELSAGQLQALLEGLAPVRAGSAALQWVRTDEQPEGSLSIIFRVVMKSEGILTGIVERDWGLVPAGARREPDRVRHCLEALAEVVSERPERLDAFWIASLDPLRRSGARSKAQFVAIFRAYARRDLGE